MSSTLPTLDRRITFQAYATSHPWEDFAETLLITFTSSTLWKWRPPSGSA